MMISEPSVPLPLDPSPAPEADDKRLWVGNIDTRLTEYHLIKLLQQYGKMTKFDFLFHKSGPLRGQPRGYCFVTYETRDQAQIALASLNGKPVLNKKLTVKWAHTVPNDEICPKKPANFLAGAAVDSSKNVKSVKSQISAIEEKLKAMEEQSDQDLEMCLSVIPRTVTPENAKKQPSNVHRKTRDLPYSRPNSRNFAGRRR